MVARRAVGHQRFCMQGLKAQGSPGKISVAPVLRALQRKACAAKKPSGEEALLVTFGASKVTAQRQLSGENII